MGDVCPYCLDYGPFKEDNLNTVLSTQKFSAMQGERFWLERGKLAYSFPKIVKSFNGIRNSEPQRDFGWEKNLQL